MRTMQTAKILANDDETVATQAVGSSKIGDFLEDSKQVITHTLDEFSKSLDEVMVRATPVLRVVVFICGVIVVVKGFFDARCDCNCYNKYYDPSRNCLNYSAYWSCAEDCYPHQNKIRYLNF